MTHQRLAVGGYPKPAFVQPAQVRDRGVRPAGYKPPSSISDRRLLTPAITWLSQGQVSTEHSRHHATPHATAKHRRHRTTAAGHHLQYDRTAPQATLTSTGSQVCLVIRTLSSPSYASPPSDDLAIKSDRQKAIGLFGVGPVQAITRGIRWEAGLHFTRGQPALPHCGAVVGTRG